MPDRSDRYQLPSWPKTQFDRDLWNEVFGDIAERLEAREGLEASFEMLQAQGVQASLDYIQATVAPQIATLQVSIDLAQDQIDKIVIDGISPNSAKLGGQLPGYYATAQALADGLAAKVAKTRKVAGKELSADVLLEKADVGLGNVDNTMDADKPVSTPQAAALAKRVPVDAAAGFTKTEKAQAVANIGAGLLAGFRNLIINPAGLQNQRGVVGAVTLAAGAFGHDRMKAGAAGCTYTYAAGGGVIVFTITAGSLQQVIPASELVGREGAYMLSWDGTAQGRINAGAYGASGTVGAVLTQASNHIVEWTAGTMSKPQLERDFVTEFTTMSTYELTRACHHYFRRISEPALHGVVLTGYGPVVSYQIDPPMRAAPALSFPNPVHIYDGAGGEGAITGVASVNGTNPWTLSFLPSLAAGGAFPTAGRPVMTRFGNGGRMDLNAEL
ncbi:hypothetical protein AAIH46_17895 [Rhizobium sp. 0TCS1.26]|uniref:hypothetical protein n=1 Tax=Rhizobium sp. 0TCS1.26 TaxID=3142623 RepID=UPI003D2BD66E